MSKHTPGPWINCQAVGQRLSSRRIISDSNKISTVVADVPDYGETSASERHANARLIAAAPDLLEALRNARSFIKNGVDLGYIRMPDADCPDSAHNTLPAIEAALAKARGDGK